MRKVYENIEMIRSARNITKRSIAQHIGVSEMQCARMLWGESKIPADLVKGIVNFLGITDINIVYDDQLTDSVVEQEKLRAC